MRNKKQPEYRRRQFDFYCNVTNIVSDYQKKNLGFKLNVQGLVECPVGYKLFHSVFNKTTDSPLEQSQFFFIKKEENSQYQLE